METKRCSKCKKIKSIYSFFNCKRSNDGFDYECKECSIARVVKWQKANPDKKKLYDRTYQKKHPEKYFESQKRYRKNHPEKAKELYRNSSKIWFSKNKNRLNRNIFSGIYQSLKYKNYGNYWEKLVGYTLKELITYLENKFKDGMSWNNYGKWHIDHIIPFSLWKFNSYNDREFKQCWALCNLQPLWANENRLKGNKIINNNIDIRKSDKQLQLI